MKPKEYFQGVWGQNLDSGFQKQSYHNQVKFEKKKKKKSSHQVQEVLAMQVWELEQ